MKTLEPMENRTRCGESGSCWMRMGHVVTAHTLPGIQQDLLRELSCHREVVIDFSDVMVVDAAGMRAILAIRQEAVRKNKSLLFISHSKYFLQLLESMGNAPSAAARGAASCGTGLLMHEGVGAESAAGVAAMLVARLDRML